MILQGPILLGYCTEVIWTELNCQDKGCMQQAHVRLWQGTRIQHSSPCFGAQHPVHRRTCRSFSLHSQHHCSRYLRHRNPISSPQPDVEVAVASPHAKAPCCVHSSAAPARSCCSCGEQLLRCAGQEIFQVGTSLKGNIGMGVLIDLKSRTHASAGHWVLRDVHVEIQNVGQSMANGLACILG